MSIKNTIFFVKRVVNVMKSYKMWRLKDYISYNEIIQKDFDQLI